MASLLNRVRSAAASATSSVASSASASSSNSFIKRALYEQPAMSVAVVLGTVGCLLPLWPAVTEAPRAALQGPGRLKAYTERVEQLEAERKQRILHDIEGSHGNPRVDALRDYLQHSAKYSRE